MTAHFIVRAQLADPADREDFDRWYETEHLPDALQAFKSLAAWRGWSDVTPGIHLAFYEFPDLASARAILDSEALAGLIAEFDRLWQGRVTRTRETVECLQEIGSA